MSDDRRRPLLEKLEGRGPKQPSMRSEARNWSQDGRKVMRDWSQMIIDALRWFLD